MANVTPGTTVSSTTTVDATVLNLLAQPTVTLGSGEVLGSNIAANQSVTGLTIAADSQFIGSASTDTFSAAISLTIGTSKGNTRKIACTSSTGSTITPSSGGTAGQQLLIVFTTDGIGGNVITYASPFKSTGTHTLTGTNAKFTAHFVSDGTNFCEVARTAALS